jgi:hypothetical protein
MSKHEKQPEKGQIKIISANGEKCFLHPEFVAALVSSGKLQGDGVYTASCTFTMVKKNTVLVIDQDVNNSGRNMFVSMLDAIKAGGSPEEALDGILAQMTDGAAKIFGKEKGGEDLTSFDEAYGKKDDDGCDCALCKDDKQPEENELN